MAAATPAGNALPTADDLSALADDYGITLPTMVEPAKTAPKTSADEDASFGRVLKNYGLSIPGVTDAQPKSEKARGRALEALPSGKVSPTSEPREFFTPETRKLGEERGWPMQFVSGIPIAGPAANVGWAGIKALGGTPGSSPQNSYWDRLTAEFSKRAAADRYYREAHPEAASAAEVAGNLLGYGALGRVAPSVLGLGPGGTPLNVYRGGLWGGLINFLDAAGRGDQDPIDAAKIGALSGALGPLAGQGVRSGTRAAASYLWPRPGPMSGLTRPHINMLLRTLDEETPQTIAQKRQLAGPHAFLSDINQPLTDIAGALSDAAGPSKGLIRGAYTARAAQQPLRVAQALDRAMGPNADILQVGRLIEDERKRVSDPLYEQWRNARVQPTPALQKLIPRLQAAGAFRLADELAEISGKPTTAKFFVPGSNKNFPTTETWDLVKRGLDRAIDRAYSGKQPDKEMARELIKLRGELIGEIEKSPAGQIWKQARQEFASRSALIDQLHAGRDDLIGGRSGNSVSELREELRGLSAPELMARIQGVRAAIHEAMTDRTEGASRVRAMLLTPANREKIIMLVGQRDGPRLIRELEQEGHLASKYPWIVPNPNTGASAQDRAARANMLSAAELPVYSPKLNEPLTFIPPSYRPHAVLQDLRNQRAARGAPDLAQVMLTPEGPQLNNLINAMFAERARLDRAERRSTPASRMLTGLITGPGQFEYRRRTSDEKKKSKR